MKMSDSPNLSNEQQDFCHEVEAFGDVCQMHPLSVDWSASGSTFWCAKLTSNGQACFLKRYAPDLAQEAMIEGKMACQYAADIARLELKHVAASCPIHTYTLRDGSVVVVSPYVHGEVLMDLVRAGKPLDPARSEVLRRGLIDLAQVALHGSLYHRDINPKNLLLAADKLVLIDFQTAIPKVNPRYQNPDFNFIRSNCGLGFDYSPRRGLWNDAFSVLTVFTKVCPILSPSGQEPEIQQRLSAIAQQAPTLKPEYIVDDAWLTAARKRYWHLRLRPWWTYKATSREKWRVVFETLREIFQSAHQRTAP